MRAVRSEHEALEALLKRERILHNGVPTRSLLGDEGAWVARALPSFAEAQQQAANDGHAAHELGNVLPLLWELFTDREQRRPAKREDFTYVSATACE